MIKNWEKLYDQLSNIHQAASAANELGYWGHKVIFTDHFYNSFYVCKLQKN